jgi:hypothetical protein
VSWTTAGGQIELADGPVHSIASAQAATASEGELGFQFADAATLTQSDGSCNGIVSLPMVAMAASITTSELPGGAKAAE